jgi:hypothetical protein
MNIKIILFTVSILFGYLFVAQSKDVQDNNSKDSIKIYEISPEEGTVLKKGSSAIFKVTINYILVSAKTGSIFINIQDNENRVIKSVSKVVKKGIGSEEFTIKVEIPADVESIIIFTPLLPSGGSQTTVVDTKMFEVE